MCKEDVRLARAASPGQSIATTAVATGMKVLAANPNRYSLHAAWVPFMDATLAHAGFIAAVQGTAIYPLIGLSNEHPAGHVTILDVGQLIEYEIWMYYNDNANINDVRVAETFWTQELEKI